jgi:AbrB family looped-hinge helix DNA binding protein
MVATTLTERGQLEIPAAIREKYGLTPGTQIEILDDDGSLRLILRQPLPKRRPEDGFGMIKVPSSGKPRRLSDFDAAELLDPARKP